MIAPRRLGTFWLSVLAVALCVAPAGAGEPKGPNELVHVPTEEMDVLLRADSQGIVLRYAEYQRLLTAARARVDVLEAQPPVDGALVSAEGALDLTPEGAARLTLRYDVEVLADGPRSVPFPLRNLALETLLIQDADGAPSGRYEELAWRPRLRFDAPGPRTVSVTGSAAFARKGEQRLLDLWLPPAAAMALALRFPAGVEGVVWGEGSPVEVRAPSDRPYEVSVRPGRTGRLRVAFAPAAKGTNDGPPILDTRTNSLHTVEDGLIHSRVILNTDVFRTPVQQLTLQVPAGLAIRALEGKGVTGFRRDEERAQLVVDLEKPFLGTVTVVLEGEAPYLPGPAVEMPNVTVPGSVRHRAEMALRFGRDVRVQSIRPTSGRRLPASRAKGQRDLLRYRLWREDARLVADLAAGAVRLDAMSTYYLNLAEAGKTLLATTTYRVLEGTVFTLRPRMPGGYELRNVSINGRSDGFTRDLRPDGTLEIALARGVGAGGEISLAATLEQSQADWVPDGDPVQVPFAVPSAGATREEGLVGVGADAAFRVLEAALGDLVPVGAADLTARGIAAAGLVYGYRIDGDRPAVTLEVRRHDPMLEARVITTLLPSARRLDVVSVVSHEIRRAGVRHLEVDVPAWAEKGQVRFDSPFVRGAAMLEGEQRPADVPAGYERWRVDLNQRVIGRHATVVRYHADQAEENWQVPAQRALGVRVPLERTERLVVVQRADGLEVRVDTQGRELRAVELTELPPETAINPLRVLEILRLANGGEGVGLQVHRHAGAAVLDAIATAVHLRTAVAREGVLRTRAWVELFNVERQFLAVTLPVGSELVGAVVDGEAVKVLADPSGVLLIPIPTARARSQTTVASLTYETKLTEPLGGSLSVPGPTFHDLEVLQTVHRVAFDPDIEIERVGGDYGRVSAPAAPTRKPWIVAFVAGLGSVMGGDADDAAVASQARGGGLATGPDLETAEPVIKDEEIADHVETDNDLPYEESFGAAEGLSDAPFTATREGRASAERQAQELARRLAAAQQRLDRSARSGSPANRPPPDLAPPAGAVPPGLRAPTDPTPAPPPAPLAPAPDPGDAAPGTADDGGGAPRPRADRHHEGDLPPAFERGAGKRRGGRRKGLLSLDVPVVMGPHVVVARRLGTGGSIEIDVRTRASRTNGLWWVGLVLTAIGLLAGAGIWVRKALVIAGGAGLAGLTALLLGEVAGGFVVVLVDVLTLLALIWAGAWLLRKLVGLLPRARAAVPAGASGPTAAALLVLALLGASASGARADEPRPPVPNVKPPQRVFVPYDPADPTHVRPTDRVFLPLKTYLTLFRAAHPDSDPRLVALGRTVTVIQARYGLDVPAGADALAAGTATYRFAKRGGGTVLVTWPLAGLAVTEATLDDRPVQLLLDKGIYRIAVTGEGDHTLALRFHVPIVPQPDGRVLSFDVAPFAGARLDIRAPAFEGDVRVSGAGRVEIERRVRASGRGTDCLAQAWLGHARRIRVHLRERAPAELPTTVRTRAESVTVHSLRDAGTESRVEATLFVLQGGAPFVDLELPPGVEVLEASGSQVLRWESLGSPSPRVRLLFRAPVSGAVQVVVRALRPAASAERSEELPPLAVLDTTGESGRVVVNHDPSARLSVLADENLFRIARPSGKAVLGPDGAGRVLGAWRFAARPTRLSVRAERLAPRMDVDSQIAVVFGDDRVRSQLLGRVRVETRAPIGTLVFALPGVDEVRSVTSAGLDTWWLEGEGDQRRLHVRYADLRQGDLRVDVRLSRRLGGQRDGIAVPRWALEGARHDRGRLVLFTLPDVEQKVGSVAGLRSLPLAGLALPASGVDGARAVNAYAWDAAIAESLPVGLRDPDLEKEAVVVTLVAPGDEEHRLEHLVLFDVRRGSTDRLQLFVPDGGPDEAWSRGDVVTTRDLREMRRDRVTRKGADGVDVAGTLYDIRLQTARGGIIEVTVSQVWQAREGGRPEGPLRPVRVVRPEDVAGTHWFSLVRTFLDGTVEVGTLAGRPDPVAWDDLPFVPAGLREGAILRRFAAREPYTLSVGATRHAPGTQADAIVQAAVATVVVGMDGYARVRMDYRIFNRGRQFLRLKLPERATLFGATAAGKAIKPLAGAQGTVLIPVPKVPLGGRGYPVSLVYRARAGADIQDGGSLTLLLPAVLDDVVVDRTVVQLYVPDGYAYDFDSAMLPTTREDVAADLAEVAVREARELLKLAEQGTLNQRWAAGVNGAALIEYARQTLQQAPGAAQKHRALVSQLDQLDKQLSTRNAAVRQDLEAAQRERRQSGPSVEEFSSNARNIVGLDDVTNGLDDEVSQEREQTVAGKNKAGWVFNPTMDQTRSGSEGYGQLKKNLQTKLRDRAVSDARKNFQNVASQQEAPAGEAAGKPKGQAAPSQTAQTFDYKQVQWLNDNLQKEQERNRQLGAVDTYLLNRFTPPSPAQQGMGQAGQGPGRSQQIVQTDESTRLNDLFVTRYAYGLQPQGSGGRGVAGGGAGGFVDLTAGGDVAIFGSRANPSAGAYFNDWSEGDFRGRTENVFDRTLELLEGRMSRSGLAPTPRFGDANGDGVWTSADGPAGKVGLMGVDVDLPRVGQVYYFRALREGAAIEIEASRETVSVGGRVAILLLILAAIAVLGHAVRRRFVAAANT